MDERQLSFSFEDEEKKRLQSISHVESLADKPSQNVFEARSETVPVEKKEQDIREFVEGSFDCPRCGKTAYGEYQTSVKCPECGTYVYLRDKE